MIFVSCAKLACDRTCTFVYNVAASSEKSNTLQYNKPNRIVHNYVVNNYIYYKVGLRC